MMMDRPFSIPRLLLCGVILSMLNVVLNLSGIDTGAFGGIMLGGIGSYILKPFWWNG